MPRLVRAALDALLGAALLVVGEWAIVTWLSRSLLAGPWEVRDGLTVLAPLAWLAAGLGSMAGSVLLVVGQSSSLRARAAVALVLGGFGLAVGLGVSQGRHFAALPARLGFVALLVALGLGSGYGLAPRFRRGMARAPWAMAVGAVLLAALFDLANHWFLPRLYPAFHLGLTALTVALGAVLGHGLGASKWLRVASAPVFALGLFAAPSLARKLSLADNLRLIFIDRGPVMSLGVEVATFLAPPPPLDTSSTPLEARIDGGLEVDWRGRDIVLISVDALRADHVGAYGYPRATTPHLDALAQEGALFLRAYCPTPHTSYSVTSMMTGKNLRPLILQGLGADSDTFAGILRSYGYRTAAFYPPAVFFIDPQLFAPFRDRHLDFEYARVEFADPHERAEAVRTYLASQTPEQRVFLWVHLFEPHEPYLAHPEHPFGDRDIDRYDSEIALADDGIGEIVSNVRARRPRAVVLVTADHGEEFGEHHGRYHGTTVYEEQVRVPLIVATPGLAPRRIETPVQTIDILPTVLAALDVPRPPRIAGDNLGAWLRGDRPDASSASGSATGAGAGDAGSAPAPPRRRIASSAFAETDEQTLLAQDEWRLVCARRAGACALYDLDLDPGELRDAAPTQPERFLAMKAALRRVEASQGRYENVGAPAEGGRAWPDPIRRGLAGDADAAREVAALLDDSDVVFRRKAAEVLFNLKRPESAPELRLALSRDDDPEVRNWCALALTRLGEGAPRTIELLDDPDLTWRRLAALALAENGDARGGALLVQWWQSATPAYARAREVLAALAQIRCKEASPALVRSLDDVRLRPYLAEALAAIGQPSARGPLLERWATERYQNTRLALAEALVRLGAKGDLAPPLVRFLGTPDPLPNGLDLARRAGVLGHVGGPSDEQLARIQGAASRGVLVKVVVPPGGNGTGERVLVRAHVNDGSPGSVRIGARLAGLEPVELDPRHAVTLEFPDGAPTERFAKLPLELTGPPGDTRLVVFSSDNLVLDAIAVVPLSDELPPPPPEPWKPSVTDSTPATEASPPEHLIDAP